MILLIGSFKIGLVSMIPNLTPIVLVLGFMGWLGVPLDAFTLLIGSIAMGLAVDDTIHFMHNFRRYYERSGDVTVAVRETLASTGQALLFTSLVLSTGFFIFTLASLNNLFFFGLLTGLAILLAFLADLILAPALMAVVVGRRGGSPARKCAPEEAR
jgi:predicted RND superfamily exporter protein